MKIGLLTFLAGVLILTSCTQNKKRADYIIKIDSLSSILTKEIENYKNIDSSLIRNNLNNIDSQLFVLDSIDSLSIIPEKAIYSELGQSFRLFLEENPQIIKEASFSKNQLANLKFDTENKLINNNQLQTYFIKERNAVNTLQNKMELFQKKINSQLKNYELLNSRIEYLLDSLTQN